MIELPYKDWYNNLNRIPDEQSLEYKDFFDFHKEVCLNGCTVDGEFISGFLYWHLNFWHTEVDKKNENGKITQDYANPLLRDNEWIIATEIERAEREKKGLAIFGIRRFSKSVLSASYLSYGATFDENSQNVITGLNAPDIKLITDKIDKGLNHVPKAWQWQRIEDNWKNQVTLGIKLRGGKRIPFSYILIRNLDNGENEEAIAGTKPRKLIIDEAGKGAFIRGLQAATPGFTSPYGWICSPIVLATGGDMKKFQDAKKLCFNPDEYNFLSYPDIKNPKRKHIFFINAVYRMEAKKSSTLGAYLNKPKKSPLHEIPMLVSDPELALDITRKEIEKKKRAGDKSAWLKEKMYYPIEVDDIFLNEDVNIYNIDAAKAQQVRIKSNGWEGAPVELYHDGEKIVHKFSEKSPITEYPVRSQSKDAPIVIYEFPLFDPPMGLYVAGIDPYRQGKAKYSESLGAVYIFKRMHDIESDKFQNMIVASYVARPDNKSTWEEQARLLVKYYNALTLCENDDISFIEYMKAKGDERYLQRQPPWLKEIVPNSTVNRDFGIHRSAEKIRDHLNTAIKRYMDEILFQEKDENGSIIREETGVIRIYDYMLLEEIINFNEVDNFDRQVAFSLALAMSYHLDPIMGAVETKNSDPRFKSYFDKTSQSKTKKTSSLFPSEIFNTQRSSPINRLFK